MINGFNQFFDANRSFGVIFIRVVFGWRLIAGTWKYVFGIEPVQDIIGFFSSLGIPFPDASAMLSLYAQFTCGILFLLGLWTRLAAVIMAANFMIAILAAHLSDPIVKSFAAWAMLAGSFTLLFQGAGRVSLDGRIKFSRDKTSSSHFI